MGPFDDILANNDRYADGFSGAALGATPVKKLAVLTCMDARIDVHKILGLEAGDAHVLRNAGGAVTDDAIRSLLISSILGTDQVAVIHHTDCKMRASTEES
jgi:carbonic anhydrase